VNALFVLGHMRCYSSLLCHILGSHPEIDGYCETHIKYRWRPDLLRLRRRVARLTGEPLRGRYVLDKMLHNYPLAPSIVSRGTTRALVLLRRPPAALLSVVSLGREHIDVGWYQDLERVTGYYESRLARLAMLARALGRRALFVEAESLLTHPERVLARIASFLELSSPLATRYRSFAHTGEPGYGDPSALLLAGEVQAAAPPPHARGDCELPREYALRAERAYAACRAQLLASCI